MTKTKDQVFWQTYKEELLKTLNKIEKPKKEESKFVEDWLQNYNARSMVLGMAINGGGLWRGAGEDPETFKRYKNIMKGI